MTRSAMDQRMDEFDLARRALKWILEHRVYWESRGQCLCHPGGWGNLGTKPLCEPPDDLMIFILALVREIDLDAEHAG